MLSEKLLKEVENTIDGIVETGGINLEDLDYTIDNILSENGVNEYIEDEEGEEIENKEYENISNELRAAIEKDSRLKIFEPGPYAYNGNLKTLNISYICSNKFNSPFEAMEEEY